MLNFIYGLVILLTLLYVSKYLKVFERNNDIEYHERSKFEKLKNHLLDNSSISQNKKPIMWIYLDFEQNARKYIDFATKNSKDLNMPYMLLCIKTIIDNCGDSFNVVIIDENSFSNLIPGWNIDLSKLSDPLKIKYVNLAKLQILKNFGGLFVPPSFICKNNLYDIYYENCIYNYKVLTFEFLNTSPAIKQKFIPKIEFIGCKKNNTNLDIIIQEYEYCLAKDYTEDSIFQEKLSQILIDNNNIVNVEDGTLISTKDKNNNPILIEDLMENKKINLSNEHIGIYIPALMLKKRNKYNWFLYLCPIEVLSSNTFIGRYLSHSI